MTNDMMFGETDLEAEPQEKDEIIMSLRLNERLLKDKLEISRRNMSKQLERMTALEKENEKLKKQINDCKDYKLLDEICTIFQRYGIDTGYNKRILEIALENLTNGDD